MTQRHTFTTFLILAALCLSGCAETVSDLDKEDLTLKVENEQLLVQNRFSHPVYLFIVESGTAALIQWAPLSTDQNQINPGNTKTIYLNEIFGYTPEAQINVYYWSKKDPSFDDVNFLQIKTGS